MDSLVDKTKAAILGDKPQAAVSKAPKAQKASKKSKAEAATGSEYPLKADPEPQYLAHRIALFDRLKAEYDAEVAAKPREEIRVTLPSGDIRVATSWETTPLELAGQVKKSLVETTVIAKVNGQLWDLTRPLEESCTLEFLDFDHPEGKRVFWHSSAHVLGEAAELHYGCLLCIGPPTTEGFFYEMSLEDRTVVPTDFPSLEALVRDAVKQRQKFERLVISKENLLEMFKHNKYKQHIIRDKIPDGTCTTVYRCGPLIDLCVGPHVPHTGRIKSMSVLKGSSSYFLGDANNDALQRIYGISFPDNKQMTEYKAFLAEAARRDHRKIGREQELFFFNEMSPGSCFFLPHGARIYNNLQNLIKEEYHKREYQEVITPNMYNSKLWMTSGHWQNYSENMFSFDVEKERFALKPMNCPGHCVVFGHRDRSYRDLPWRVADFGVLHRNEFSGALTGLTRVRRFCQDDAHIFCTPEQVGDEIAGCFDFLQHIYGIFGFTFKLELSTRPENYLGELATWEKAESQLEEALNKFNMPWEINPGDGAFYGPKIDVKIFDALKREHQCATLQLDFQLPEQFKLEYYGQDGQMKRPVMVHRAILGSLERMFAILTEHFAGKWPFWLSPRQVMVVPVSPKYEEYAQAVQKRLYAAGFYAEVDTSDNTLPKKVRSAQLSQFNFITIVGQEELDSDSVNVRRRDHDSREMLKMEEFLQRLEGLRSSRSREY